MLLLTCILTHIVDVSNHTHVVARLHIRIMAITIILLWLRLMKNARAFSLLGEQLFNTTLHRIYISPKVSTRFIKS